MKMTRKADWYILNNGRGGWFCNDGEYRPTPMVFSGPKNERLKLWKRRAYAWKRIIPDGNAALCPLYEGDKLVTAQGAFGQTLMIDRLDLGGRHQWRQRQN